MAWPAGWGPRRSCPRKNAKRNLRRWPRRAGHNGRRGLSGASTSVRPMPWRRWWRRSSGSCLSPAELPRCPRRRRPLRRNRLGCSTSRWPRRWYPVVDYGRCTNCGECVKVCRRGVFGVSDGGTVGVVRPDACGNCCPECNCACPARAIIFPQHQDPSIAGDGASATDGVGW